MPRHPALLHLAAGVLAALFAPSLAARDDARWWKVELMVFAHQGAGSSEQWEPTPALAYPPQYRFLVYPDTVLALRAAHEGPSILDEFGRLNLLPPPQELPEAPDIPEPGTVGDANEPAPAPVEAQPAEEAAEEGPPRPTPFVALPAAQQEFRGKAAYMQRTGEYRILFHEAWAQPMLDEQAAVPIVLDRSGDDGNWPELQGTVTLYLSRYLHIDTDLWLNTPGNYLPGSWRMPAAPLGPPTVITVEPEPPPALEEEVFTAVWREEPAPEETEPVDETDALAELAPVYPWRHAVLLQQRRRMRSHEVHYIDHPLFGLVVKLTPLDDEDLAALAAREPPLEPESGQ